MATRRVQPDDGHDHLCGAVGVPLGRALAGDLERMDRADGAGLGYE